MQAGLEEVSPESHQVRDRGWSPRPSKGLKADHPRMGHSVQPLTLCLGLAGGWWMGRPKDLSAGGQVFNLQEVEPKPGIQPEVWGHQILTTEVWMRPPRRKERAE